MKNKRMILVFDQKFILILSCMFNFEILLARWFTCVVFNFFFFICNFYKTYSFQKKEKENLY